MKLIGQIMKIKRLYVFYGNLIDDWQEPDYSTQAQDHGIDFFDIMTNDL